MYMMAVSLSPFFLASRAAILYSVWRVLTELAGPEEDMERWRGGPEGGAVRGGGGAGRLVVLDEESCNSNFNTYLYISVSV